ncbi:hypothetical protein GCM10010211_65460 [Streptomyces albospinus]|uniref:Uncharacterized protein n=1 Tax=Streptomyces albospinus TaxID=285515 RepID=A0ABQ2VMJ3_9ACTN|nr:hypothetical protein GCM10010211_65460 [Streptomyces albospinus]
MVKAADALRPGGALAVVATRHVAGGSEEFFVEVQDCYERFDPATSPGLLRCIAGLIDRRYGVRVTKRYLTELRVSRTVPRVG